MPVEYPSQYLFKRIVQAKTHIDVHYATRIDLDNIASQAHFSRFHFIRLFKMAYGKTPHQYLTQVRMKAATELLRKGISIQECCLAVGFESIGSFTTLFRRYAGTTPAAFQRKVTQRNERIVQVPLQFIPACFANRTGWFEKSNFEELG